MGKKKYSDKGKSGYEIDRANSRFARICQAGKASDMRGCNSKWRDKTKKQTKNRVRE